MKFLTFLSVSLLLVVTGCSTSKVSLAYNPGAGAYPVRPGARAYQVSVFRDLRQSQGEYGIGAVRSPVGVPLDILQTNIPVSVAVTNGFAYGLESRGMLTPARARYIVSGDILALEADQVVRPGATGRILVHVTDQYAGGRQVFSKVYSSEQVQPPFAGGKAARDMLSALTSQALQQIIDMALDDPEFRRSTTAN